MNILKRIGARAPILICLMSLGLIIQMRYCYPNWWKHTTFYTMLSGEYDGAQANKASWNQVLDMNDQVFAMEQQYVDGRFNGQVTHYDRLFSTVNLVGLVCVLSLAIFPFRIKWIKDLENEVVRNIET